MVDDRLPGEKSTPVAMGNASLCWGDQSPGSVFHGDPFEAESPFGAGKIILKKRKYLSCSLKLISIETPDDPACTKEKILASVIQSVDCVYKDAGFFSFSQGYLMGRNENFGFEWRPIIDGNVSKDQLYVRGILFAMGKLVGAKGSAGRKY